MIHFLTAFNQIECYRCESDGMAVVWNGYETGKKIYKTHPDGLPAQYNAFRQVFRKC